MIIVQGTTFLYTSTGLDLGGHQERAEGKTMSKDQGGEMYEIIVAVVNKQ